MKKKPIRVSFFRPAPLKDLSKKIYKKITGQLEKRPLISFFSLLLILLVLITLGNFVRKPKIEDQSATKEPINVQTYSIGSASRIKVSAQVEKAGVLQINAQGAGIVNKITVKEGQSITKGKTLISISSNYSGANAASVQKQLAATQAQSAKVTYESQKEIIEKQKEVTNQSDSNFDQLRSITDKSKDETNSLITLNESIINSIDSNISNLESTNVLGANDDLILQSKQLKSQFLAATNQAKSSLRNIEYQKDENNPPSDISNLQKEITQKQLDLQEKTLKLNLDAANLQTKLAQINESLFFPTAPFTGVVQKVHVRVGQQVTPGQLLVTISSSEKSQTAVSYVPQNVAFGISKLDTSILNINNQKFEVNPIYISTETVLSGLYAVIFPIPDEAANFIQDKGYIDVEIPIGYSYTSASVPYIPLDSVHQTQENSTVFVIENETATDKSVTLGQVQGNFIEVVSGLSENDIVITSRNVTSGDKVKVNNSQ